jgi:hypothetical protein
MAGFVWAMVALLGPLAAPIAWLLDRALPEEPESLTRGDVVGLVAVHRELAREGGLAEPFGADEEALIKVGGGHESPLLLFALSFSLS